MIVKKGDYSVIPEEKDSGENPKKPKKNPDGRDSVGSDPEFSDSPVEMDDIPRVGQETPGVKTFRDFDNGKDKNTAKKPEEVKSSKPSIVSKKIQKPNWDEITSNASSRSSLSDEAKKMIKKLKGTEPIVNWRKELKKFFDQTFKSTEWILPNKRFLGGGDILYGRKNVGDDTLKTIVAAVDTSSSISKEQIKIFVKEVMGLVRTFDADQTIIIYCSDDIDNVDRIKKGGEPDFTKIASTGGNMNGFIPPFQWVQKEKIKPSVFIYLTDTGGEMPDSSKYGISKYSKRVFWFICAPKVYNKPPFGKSILVPVAGLK